MQEPIKYVINLIDRQDRRREMERQLERVNWTAIFSNSVYPQSAGGFPSLGSRGCFESHLFALRHASKTKRHAVIMEDDLDFRPDFESQWQAAWHRLQQRDWAIFYPAHTLAEHHHENGFLQLEPSRRVLCTHFMAFNAEHIETIIVQLETIRNRPPGHPLGGPMHVDGAYSTIRNQIRSLTTLAHVPSLGHQRPSRSDIAPRRFYDNMAALSSALRLLRKAKSLWKNRH